MRRTSLCVVVLAALIAGPSLGGDVDGDLKKIQGTWRFVSEEMDGKMRPPETLTKLTITFTGDKFAVKDDGKVVQAGTHKLDGSKKPGHVDATITEGEGKGGTMLGIYELKGNSMRVCFDLAGKDRPTSFSAKAGQFAAVIERAKKKS